MTSVEASMRLDAVASAGMGMSRSKLKVRKIINSASMRILSL